LVRRQYPPAVRAKLFTSKPKNLDFFDYNRPLGREAVAAEIEKRARSVPPATDGRAIMKASPPVGDQGPEQKVLLSQIAAAARGGGNKKE
jgi:hypothetical protein